MPGLYSAAQVGWEICYQVSLCVRDIPLTVEKGQMDSKKTPGGGVGEAT